MNCKGNAALVVLQQIYTKKTKTPLTTRDVTINYFPRRLFSVVNVSVTIKYIFCWRHLLIVIKKKMTIFILLVVSLITQIQWLWYGPSPLFTHLSLSLVTML